MHRYNFPTKKTNRKLTVIVTVAVILIYTAVMLYSDYKSFSESKEALSDINGLFSAHFIDVGQGDATLLRSPDGSFMLIDCGITDSSDYLVKYLKDARVKSLEYLLITHPHEDHYGGASAIIKNFPVENFIVHKDFDGTYPYNRYIRMLSDNKFGYDTKIIKTQVNDRFRFSDCAEFMILSPEEVDYYNYNNSSLSVKLVYGNTSFLFTGDAEAEIEREMISAGYNLDSDVFHAGHHGSSTSNTDSFVSAVSPKYAVISCGENNDYGHPHWETLAVFREQNIKVLRTDKLSNIVIVSDGTTTEYAANLSALPDSLTPETQSGNMFIQYAKSLISRLAA